MFTGSTCATASARLLFGAAASDIVGPAIAAETLFQYTSLGPATAPTIRKLADLAPRRLALMHGSSFSGNASGAVRSLADHYEERLRAALA